MRLGRQVFEAMIVGMAAGYKMCCRGTNIVCLLLKLKMLETKLFIVRQSLPSVPFIRLFNIHYLI